MCDSTWFARPDAAPSTDPPGVPKPSQPHGAPVLDGVAQPVSRSGAPVSRARRGRAKQAGSPAGRGAWAVRIGASAAFLASAAIAVGFAFRPEVVRAWPEAASLFGALGIQTNLVGLNLVEVSSARTEEDGKPVLLVEGEIRSASPSRVGVPRLDFTVEDESGEALYQWSTKPPVPEIAPGDAARFTVRLPSPPPAGRRVIVTFRRERDGASIALR